MLHTIFQICLLKLRIADNSVRSMKRHLYIHLSIFIFIIFLMMQSGLWFFHLIFRFLVEQELFGPRLMDGMMGMLMMVFFSMLIFSNLIITLTTTYISREVEFLFAQPVDARLIFIVKLIESIFYSSWAFAVLSLPLIMAFGMAREAEWWYYVMTVALIIPFLIIPSTIGSALTMCLAAFIPARRTRLMAAVLMVMVVLIAILVFRFMGGTSLLLTTGQLDISRIQQFLGMGHLPLLPNYWLSEGIVATSHGDLRDAFYWLAVLWSQALMSILLCLLLVPSLYYRGWCLARESVTNMVNSRGRSLLDRFEFLYFYASTQVRAIVTKDLKTFWRDPAQWSQFIILFGLLVIYIFSIRGAYNASRQVQAIVPHWKTLICFFNLGATSTILAIFTTRFFYPLLSLEGKQYWAIGLAPIPRGSLVWEKFWFCWTFAAMTGLSLMLFSGILLNIGPFLFWQSISTIFVMSLGLTSLSVGLGAITPNFNEDNPARIANGIGGTLNIILSLAYIGLVIALLYPVSRAMLHGRDPTDMIFLKTHPQVMYLMLVGAIVLHAVTIIAPMTFGIKRWREMEF